MREAASTSEIAGGPRRGYRPTFGRRAAVYGLAFGLSLVSLLSLAPAMEHWNLATAPGWARLIWLLAALQLAYAAWLATVPDWSSVRVAMVVSAGTGSIYGMVLAVTLTTRETDLDGMPLDLAGVRDVAPIWCAAMVALASLMACLCGRTSYQWRRALQIEASGD